MSAIEESVLENLRALPIEQQRQVLEFVQKLKQRQVPSQIERPIWEVIQETSAQVPDEAWGDVPTDGAEQHDHYLYGAPKK
jgi:hypothetical protein